MVSSVAQRGVLERAITPKEHSKLLRYLSSLKSNVDARDRHIMQFLINTGVRPAVLMRITVDEARQIIRTDHMTVPALKRGRSFQIYVSTNARTALKGLITVRKRYGYAVHGDMPLLCTKRGDGITLRALEKRFKKHSQQLGFPVIITPYSFRHAFAKKFCRTSSAANPLVSTAHVLGHTTTKNTSAYLLPDREELAEDMERAQS
jgi:integrase